MLDSMLSDFLSVRAPSSPTGDYVLWLSVSFVVHSALFFLLPATPWLPKAGENPINHKPGKKYDRFGHSVQIRNGLVSTVHAVMACIIVAVWHWQYRSFDPVDFQRNMQGGVALPGNTNGDMWLPLITCITLGYFIYGQHTNTICMVYYHKYLGSMGSYIHHFVIGIAIAAGVLTGVGRMFHVVYLVEEFSTPFLNMKNLYDAKSKAYKIWAMCFAASFFLCRGFYGLTASISTYYCVYAFWMNNHASMPEPYFTALVALNGISFSISRMLNIYWMSLIAKKVFCDKKKGKTAPLTELDAKNAKKVE